MIDFESIYKNKIIKLIDSIIELKVIPEKEYIETQEYEYFFNVKNHYSLTCILFLANEKNMENEFLKIIKNNLQDKYENFYNSYKNLKLFINETFQEEYYLLAKVSIVDKIDLVHYCYNLNFYQEYKSYKEYKDDNKALFLDGIFKSTLESIKTIFKDGI